MDHKTLDRIEQKVDRIDGKIDTLAIATAEQAIHIERNTTDLAEHMRRTELNEKMIMENKEAIVKSVSYLKAFHVFLGAAATLMGVLLAIEKFFS